MQGHAADLDSLADNIARGAGRCTDQRHLLSAQPVQQAGFADIRPSHQHDVSAFAQQAALLRQLEDFVQFITQRLQLRIAPGNVWHGKLFFREIQHGFDQHAQPDQILHQFAYGLGKLALQRAHGTARGLAGGGGNQISHAFRLRQIKLVVEESALGKLAWLSQARAQFEAALQHQLQHGRATMALQFQHIFTGIGMRRGEKKGDASIHGLALRVEK